MSAPRPPWTPEVDVDPARAASLIAGQFPELAAATVVPWGVGWDNVAYLVDDTWVFRFPRRAIGAPLLETEVCVLAHLAPRLPVAITAPTYVGAPAEGYPWRFAGYRALEGQTGDRACLTDAARAGLAAPLGTALAALHAVGPERGRAWGAPEDAWGRLDVATRNPQTEERLDALVAAGVVSDADAAPLRAILAEGARTLASGAFVPSPTLVHGDLYSRHVIVRDGRLAGFIDWGDVHVGDPAVDLMIAHLLLPPAAHDAFLAAYGPVDHARWAIARWRAVFSAVATAWYGHAVDDVPLSAESGIALGFLSIAAARAACERPRSG